MYDYTLSEIRFLFKIHPKRECDYHFSGRLFQQVTRRCPTTPDKIAVGLALCLCMSCRVGHTMIDACTHRHHYGSGEVAYM